MRTLAEHLQFPEGPVAMPDGSVIFVELAGSRVSRAWGGGKTEVVAQVEGSPNGAAMGPGGKLYVCNNGGVKFVEKDGEMVPRGNLPRNGWIEVIDLDTGKAERLYEQCGDNLFNHPNDLVFDRFGGFYFTDSGKTIGRKVDRGVVYYGMSDGSGVREAAFPLTSPNGIGLSPDHKTLYVAETPTARVYAWDVIGPGQLRKLKQIDIPHGGRFLIGSANFQRFDSLAVSGSGRVIVGTLTNGGLTEIWPDGSHTRHHPLPDGHVTNIAFGGPELRTAFVTLAGTGKLVAMDWAEPGHRLEHQELPTA